MLPSLLNVQALDKMKHWMAYKENLGILAAKIMNELDKIREEFRLSQERCFNIRGNEKQVAISLYGDAVALSCMFHLQAPLNGEIGKAFQM